MGPCAITNYIRGQPAFASHFYFQVAVVHSLEVYDDWYARKSFLCNLLAPCRPSARTIYVPALLSQSTPARIAMAAARASSILIML